MLDQFGNHFVSVLLRCSPHFSSFDFASIFGTSEPQKVWFYQSRNIVFAKSPFRKKVNSFINFSIILTPFSDEFAIIVRFFFGIDVGIDFASICVDLQGPKMEPRDNILGQGASNKHRPLPMDRGLRLVGGDEGATCRWKRSKHHSHRFWCHR